MERVPFLQRMEREAAVKFPIIQHNRSTVKHWLVFDIDLPDAYFAAEEARLPDPNFIAVNRDNGHAHIGYRIDPPVSFYMESRREPMKFFDAVDRGFTRRLRADRGYTGFLSKNPVHLKWETVWQAKLPYELSTLNDYLEPEDKQLAPRQEDSPLGRNVTVFDGIRAIAYLEVLKFKKAKKSEGDFMEFIRDEAKAINATFWPSPLTDPEIRCLARSVSGWTWKHFNFEEFSAIQAARVRRRWSKVQTLTDSKPWEAEGICRRTWERRRQAARIRGIT